jgi:hypothetical protein
VTVSDELRVPDWMWQKEMVLIHWLRPTWRTGVIEFLYVSPPRHGFALDTGHASVGAAC